MEDNSRRILEDIVGTPTGDVGVKIQFTAPSNVKIAKYVETAQRFINSMATGDQMKLDFGSDVIGTGMTVRIDKPRRGSTKCALALEGPMNYKDQVLLWDIMQRCGRMSVSFTDEKKAKKQRESKTGFPPKAGKAGDIPISEVVKHTSVLVALEKAGITTVQLGADINIAAVKPKTKLKLDTLERVVASCKEILARSAKPSTTKAIPIKEAVHDKPTLDALRAADINTVQAGATMNIADVHDGTGLMVDTLEAVMQSCTEVLEKAGAGTR